jgi:hypothetical protein
MTKASKQDVEMLKRRVVEFKDELDALGVKVDQLDARVAVLEERLGGWKISGVLRQDLTQGGNWAGSDESRGFGHLSRARLYFDRWFGEDESIHFYARIDGQAGAYTPYGGGLDRDLELRRFFADFPVWGGAKMRVGRIANDAVEANYYLDGATGFSKHMSMGTDSWLTDRTIDVVAIEKSFGAGNVYLHVGRPGAAGSLPASAWEIYATGSFQFSEMIGLDLGVQAFFGDDTSTGNYADFVNVGGDASFPFKLNSTWTLFGGLRFKFNENIALKGMFYRQSVDLEDPETAVTLADDSTSAFRVVVDVKQEALSFTSLWLEYNHLEQGFMLPSGAEGLFNDYDFAGRNAINMVSVGTILYSDLNIWRIAAQQKWNEKWTTFLFYANYDVDVFDASFKEYGLGVAYQLNPNVLMGLSYAAFSYDDVFGTENDSQIRFRTQVTF